MTNSHSHDRSTAPGHEVLVIGAGAAGLAAAATLGRARRSVLVVDAGHPRNAPASGVHTYLAREGTPPAELLAAGRAEVRAYGGDFRRGTVTAAETTGDGGFRVTLDDGTVLTAARLLVTTGLTDELPAVPGLAGLWGRDVLHCPYCHGWEVRDRAVGILGTSPLAVHQALLWRQWTDRVTLFLHTGPEPDGDARERLAARGVAVVGGEVTRLVTEDGRLAAAELAGGRRVGCDALAVTTRLVANSAFLEGLGLAAEETQLGGLAIGTRIPADPVGATAVPGVWVAGNVANPVEQVIGAAAAGVRAAAAINADLVEADTRRAVEAARAAAAA
ncbi:NAD(P)/FAD-dependent oxidoreductase [Streptomyces sp. NPDC020983]|uniref:NAD(P)/FAD-dependent oxidoreductase n=1 Tax=Streptomyces sp. NPDC020983 TaxID=3365106 RepID=UPI00378A4455